MAQMGMRGKIVIDAKLILKAGLHIGGSNDYAPIGAVDSVFIRDALTRQPIIPGSSVKGKLRTLLAKAKQGEGELPKEFAEDDPVVARLFGCSRKQEAIPARLQFADSFPDKESVARFERVETGTYLGEVKFENTIARGSGVAKPRQIERVPTGMVFSFRLIYNLESASELDEDMKALAEGFRLLQLDYLGGHGSRGYGRVAFSDFAVKQVDAQSGEVAEETALATRFNGMAVL